MQGSRVAVVSGSRVVVVALKTVLEVKSAEGFLRNRISGCAPPPPPWMPCCWDERDSLPRQQQDSTAQQPSSTSTTTRAAEQHATSDPPGTLDTGHARHRTPDTEHQGSTAARQHGSRCSTAARQHGSRITPKTHRKQHDKTSTRRSTAAGRPERRSGADDGMAGSLCPTKVEKGKTGAAKKGHRRKCYLTQHATR